MEPIFLDVQDALKIHRRQVKHFGGSEGIRDLNLLESALFAPQATFDGKFLYSSVPEMAAVYLFHLARNHPFVDGNKRVAAMVAYFFLVDNGFEVSATQDAFEEIVMRVARSEASQGDVVRFMENHAQRA